MLGRFNQINDKSASTGKWLESWLNEKIGANGYRDENGQLDFYKMVQKVGEVWDTLTQDEQSLFGQKLAGSRQASNFANLMQNLEGIQSATDTALNSTGSAARSNKAKMDSIEGRKAQLEASISDFMTDTISSGAIKNLLSAANAMVQFFNAIPGSSQIAGIGAVTLMLGTLGTLVPAMAKFYAGGALGGMATSIGGLMMGTASIGNGALATGVANASAGLALMGGRAKDFLTGIRNAGAIKAGTTTAQGLATTSAGTVSAGAAIAPALPYLAAIATTIGILKIAANNRDKQNQAIVTNFENLVTAYDAYKKQSDNSLSTIKDIQGRQLEAQLNTEGYTKDTKENQEKYNAEYKKRMENANDSYENMEQFKTNLQGEDLREYNNALANYKFAQMEMENTRQSMQQQFASYAIAKNAKTGILGMASDALGLGFIQDLNEYSNNQDRVRESTKGMFQLQGELTYAQQHGGKTTDIEASLERYTEATARNQQAAQDSLVEIQEGYFDLMESGKKTFKTDNPMDVITEIAESGNKELSDALLRASLAMGVFDEATYNAAASLAGLEVESEFLETTYANIGQDLGAQTKGLNNVLELESKSWSKLSGEDIATITSAYNLDDEQWGNFWDAWQEGGQAKTDAVERALMQSLENTYGSEGLANMDLEMLAKYFEPLFGNQSMEIAKAIQDDAKIEEENKEQTRQEVLESGNYSMYAGAKMLGELTQGNLIGAVDQLEYNNQGTRFEVMGPGEEGTGEWQDTAENWLADLAGYGLSTSEQIAMTEEWLNRGNTLIDSEGNQLDLGQVIGMIETTTTPIDANTAAVEANTAAILSSLNQNELDALGISKNEDGTYTLPNGQIVGTPTPELTWSEENQNVIGSTTADNTTAEFAPTSDSSSMDKSPELGESAFSESGFDFFKKIFGDLFVPETTTETTVDEAPEVTHETREVETEVITPEIEDQTATVNYEANMETPEAENLTGEIDYETNVETPEVPEVPDQTIGVTADTSSADAALSGVKAEEDAIDSNKDVTITAHDNATGVLGTIVGLLNSVTDRSATVTTTYVEEHYGGPKAKGGKVTFQDRKKKFNGERHADGGTTGRSGLVGTWLGDEYTGSGQTKPELVVTPDGNAHLAGLNGWEFENLPAGTQVYSNSDTKKLLGERHANGGYIGELLKAGSASNREDIVVGHDRTPKKSSDSDKNKGENNGGNKNSSSQSNKTAAVAKTIEGYIEDIGDKLEDICKQFDTMLSVVEDSIDLLEYEEEKTDTPSEQHFKLLENKLDILNRYQAELEAQGATVENSSDYRDVLKQIAELMQDEINLRQKQYEHNRDVLETERNQMEFQGRNDPDKYVNQTIASYEKSRQSALEQAEYLMSQGYDKNSDEVIDLLEEANGYTEDIEDAISDSTQRLVESINKNFKKTESAYDYMIWQAEEEKEQLDKEQARSDALYDLESERLAKEDVRIDRLQRIQDAAKELSDVMDERVRVMTSEGFTWDVDPQAYEQAQKNYTDTMADTAREVRDENREEAHKQERIDRYEQYYGEGSYGEEALATADSTYAEVQKVKDEQEKQTHLQDKILYEQKYGNMLASEALKLASSDEELSKYTSEFIQNEVAGILDDQFGSIKGVKEALAHGDISEAMDAILKERGGYNNLSKEEKYWFDMINGYRNQKIDILGNGATKYNTAEDFQLTRDQDVDKAVRRGIIEKGLSEIKESGKEVTYKDVMNLMNQAATYKNSAYDIGTGKIDLNSKTTQTIMGNQSYDVFKDTQQIAPRNSLAEKLNSEVNQFTIHSLNVTANNADDLVVSLQNYARTTLSINTIRK